MGRQDRQLKSRKGDKKLERGAPPLPRTDKSARDGQSGGQGGDRSIIHRFIDFSWTKPPDPSTLDPSRFLHLLGSASTKPGPVGETPCRRPPEPCLENPALDRRGTPRFSPGRPQLNLDFSLDLGARGAVKTRPPMVLVSSKQSPSRPAFGRAAGFAPAGRFGSLLFVELTHGSPSHL
jgi:hypothetical protein